MSTESHSVDEKEEKTIGSVSNSKKGLSFFSRKKDSDTISKEKIEDAPVDPTTEASLPPVSFTELFRFTTKKELALNAMGIFAAICAGAAQPLMSLIFGNLTGQFVNFFAIVSGLTSDDPDTRAQSAQNLPSARDGFRSAAASDAAILVYIGIGMLCATFIYMTTWVYTGEVNAKRVRERYLRAVLRQDIAFFDHVGAGEVTTRIQTDTHLIQQGISEKVALVVTFLSAFVTGFVLAYVRCWRLALALSSILPCIGTAGAVMNHFISSNMQKSLHAVADGGTVAEEVISTVRTAQAFGTQRVLASLYDTHIAKARKVDLNSAIALGSGMSIFFFVIYSSYALSFSFGSRLIGEGHATVSSVVNVFFAILIGSFSLALLAPEMQAITHARGAAAKLFATIDRVPAIDSADPGGEKPEYVEGNITLENVVFSYPSRPTVPVVKGIDLTFRAGKTAALVGASGSGKSTVISLVERFYDPTSGVVKFDGRDVRNLNLKWLRTEIGLVSQEPVLFKTTIRENVAFGLIGTKHEKASDEEKFALIKDACVKANADGFISKLPLGYDTLVGERGFLLSGGQKQRVAIARAIVSDPKVLLLDEATSALDTQSEGIVQDALDKASAGRTTITIAHRLSTIKDADVIFVMGDGQVLEQGTHNELLAAENGAYARLVQSQKLRDSDDTATLNASDPIAEHDHDVKAKEDMAAMARDEIPLGRKNTGRSLASEIMEERRQQEEGKDKEDLSMTQLFIRLAMINREVWWRYGVGSVCAILTGLVYPAFGIVYAQALEGFAGTGAALRHAGDRNALWFFIIALISTVIIGFQNYNFSSSAAFLTAKLRSMSFKAILRQDVEFFDRDENSSGALTSNLSENPQKVNGLAGVTLGAIVQSLSTYIGGCIIGLIFAWKISLVGIACTPFLVCSGYIRLRVVVMKDQANKKAHEESAQLACEAAGSIRTVASLTREDDCCDIYSKSLEEPLRHSNKTAVWSNLLYASSQSTSFFVIALIFWFGSRLVSSMEVSTFHFFVALMGTTFGAIQAGNVFSFVPDISSAKGAGSDIMRLLDSVPSIDAESPDGKALNAPEVKGHIRLENVHFRYPTRPGVRVLRNLSLEVKHGTYIALVGQSGCGKSTVIQMIERFYDPLAGNIYLDGQNISEINVQEYRKQIALVSQEPSLYSGTIKFNILLGAIKPVEEVTQEELEQACRDANILEFIQSLPSGFETEVGGKGSQLSGGQKQRIAIARALLRNPKVLLLDEATSALDSNSEKVVQAALDKASQGRTTIAIAHRLSTIQNADRIYFIKEGQVSESGSHDELLALRGDYHEFVQLQGLSRRT